MIITGTPLGIALNLRNVDTPPAVAGSEDDEFLSTSLNAAWTVVTNSVTAVNIDTNVPSYLWIKTGTGTTNAYIITRSIASGAGDWNFTVKFSGAPSGSFHVIVMDLLVNSTNLWEVLYGFNGTNQVVSTFTEVAGVVTTQFTKAITDSPIYFHVERKGTTIATFYSTDGVAWWPMFSSTSILQASTFATLRLQFLNNGASTNAFMACDWVRRNYITLLP